MRTFTAGICSLLVALFVLETGAAAQTPGKRGGYETQLMGRLNEATIGLAAGQPEGAPLRFATELARVVDDGSKMRVLPVVTRGPFENVYDLLYLKGIDAAIIYGDVLEHFRNDARISRIDQRIHYIAHLFPSEVHIFVRPEIKRLEDLVGKPVNFNTKGTAAAYTGPIVFERLGINIDPHFIPHPVAMAEMAKSDKFAAVVFVSTKPLDPFVKRKWPEGFKFLPVPLTEKLEEYYLPAQLEAADYPGLIPDGQSIQTISVPAVLAVYAWQPRSDRYRRLVRFIDYLFERLPKLQKEAGYHPKWHELNLAATVPGWQRFQPMESKLKSAAAAGTRTAAGDGARLEEAVGRPGPVEANTDTSRARKR